MDRSTMATAKLTCQRPVLVACIFLVLATFPTEGSEPEKEQCKGCRRDIGTAVVLTRQTGRALRGLPNETAGTALKRDLKQFGGCSETDSSLYAVLECTNAVRQDPDAYSDDYPCFYQSWRHEIIGKGLGPLDLDNTLIRMAQLHTDDQARINVMTHTGSDGSSLSTRADRVHYQWSSLGENVAVGFDSAKDVVMAWMCSAGHRKNVMSCSFDSIGIGEALSGEGRHYFTQNFGCSFGEVCGCSQPSATATATANAVGTDSAAAIATATATSTPGAYVPGGRPATDVFDVAQTAYGEPVFPEPYSPPVTSPEPSPPSWVTSYFADSAGVPTRTGAPVDAAAAGDPFALPTDDFSGRPASSTATATSVASAGGVPEPYAGSTQPIASGGCNGWDWDCGYAGDIWSCRRKPRCR